jgi:alkaline phosphatase D
VQVILLDTRTFRSPLRPTDERHAPGKENYVPDASPDKTMLGAAQWRWLEEVLEEPADLRLIGSSIQVAADGHGYERWGNLPGERDRLYELLAQASSTPTAIISGDRHFAAFYKVPAARSGRSPRPASTGPGPTGRRPGRTSLGRSTPARTSAPSRSTGRRAGPSSP